MNEICEKLAAGDIIVLIAVAVAVILAVVFSFRRKLKGGGCCSGGCCNCKNCDLDKDRDKKTDNKG